MTDFKYLALTRDGATLICTINNPPKNYLIAPIVAELDRLANEVATDEALRALIITSGVEGIFITHYDVSELIAFKKTLDNRPGNPTGDDYHQMHRLIFKLQDLNIPVIAAVNGTAMGGGCELALGCDFRIKSTEGMFGLPEARLGLLPGAGGTQRMTRLIGVSKAMELMLLGNAVDGETAARLGLVHKAVPPDRVLPEALALAEELGKRPPLSIALIKQCILKGSEMPIREALRFEQDAFWETMRSDDAGRLMREYVAGGQSLDEF